MVGLSPSPPPADPSKFRSRAKSTPLSSSKLPNSPFPSKPRRNNRKSKTPKLRPPSEPHERAPAPSNRFGIRDSDISDTSSEEDDIPETDDDVNDYRRRRTRGGTVIRDMTPKQKLNINSRWSVDPESKPRSPSVYAPLYSVMSSSSL